MCCNARRYLTSAIITGWCSSDSSHTARNTQALDAISCVDAAPDGRNRPGIDGSTANRAGWIPWRLSTSARVGHALRV